MSIPFFDGKLIHETGLELCYDPDVTGLPIVSKAVIQGNRQYGLRAAYRDESKALCVAGVRANPTVGVGTPFYSGPSWEVIDIDDMHLNVVAAPRWLYCATAKITALRDCVTTMQIGLWARGWVETAGATLRWGYTQTEPATGADIIDACIYSADLFTKFDERPTYKPVEETDRDVIDLFFDEDTTDPTGRTGKKVWCCMWIDAPDTITAAIAWRDRWG
jgi:hypothetical protein